MANEIDITSINLGNPNSGNRPEFTVDRVPSQTPLPDSECSIPAGNDFTLATAQLLPLIEACQFQFPDVTPLPPTYTPPQVKFKACETFDVTGEVTFPCPAVSKSFLTLQAYGPESSDPDAPNACGIRLDGNICVDACETFDANVDIKFLNAADQPTSIIKIEPRSIPDCGFDLVGVIDVQACPSINISENSNVEFKNAAEGSYLTLTTDPEAPCNFIFDGIIDVQACKEMVMASDVEIRGSGLTGELGFISNTDGCGGMITGFLEVNACKEFKATGTANLRGSIVKSQSLTITPSSAPDCGFDFNFDAEFKACDEVTPRVRLNTEKGKGFDRSTFTVTASEDNLCSPLIELDLNADFCTETGISQEVTYDNTKPAYALFIRDESLGNDQKKCGFKFVANLPFPTPCCKYDDNGNCIEKAKCCAYDPLTGACTEWCQCQASACPPNKSETLYRLNVDLIDPRPCCSNPCRPKIDVCSGILKNFQLVETRKIQATCCPPGTTPLSIDLCSGKLTNDPCGLPEFVVDSLKTNEIWPTPCAGWCGDPPHIMVPAGEIHNFEFGEFNLLEPRPLPCCPNPCRPKIDLCGGNQYNFVYQEIDLMVPRPPPCCPNPCRPKLDLCWGKQYNFEYAEIDNIYTRNCCESPCARSIEVCKGYINNFDYIEVNQITAPGNANCCGADCKLTIDFCPGKISFCDFFIDQQGLHYGTECAGLFRGKQYATDPTTGEPTSELEYLEVKCDLVKNSDCCADIDGGVNYADMCRGVIHLFGPRAKGYGFDLTEKPRFTTIRQGSIRVGGGSGTGKSMVMIDDYSMLFGADQQYVDSQDVNGELLDIVTENKISLITKDSFYIANKGGYLHPKYHENPDDPTIGDETLEYAELKYTGLYVGTGKSPKGYTNVLQNGINIRTESVSQKDSYRILIQAGADAGSDTWITDLQAGGVNFYGHGSNGYASEGRVGANYALFKNSNGTQTDITSSSVALTNSTNRNSYLSASELSLNSLNAGLVADAYKVYMYDGGGAQFSETTLYSGGLAINSHLADGTAVENSMTNDGIYQREGISTVRIRGGRIRATSTLDEETGPAVEMNSQGFSIATGKYELVRISEPPLTHVRNMLERAEFRKITICEDGVFKEAYVLMTKPLSTEELSKKA